MSQYNSIVQQNLFGNYIPALLGKHVSRAFVALVAALAIEVGKDVD